MGSKFNIIVFRTDPQETILRLIFSQKTILRLSYLLCKHLHIPISMSQKPSLTNFFQSFIVHFYNIVIYITLKPWKKKGWLVGAYQILGYDVFKKKGFLCVV